MDNSRRRFLKNTALAGSGLLLPSVYAGAVGMTDIPSPYAGNVLLAESYDLLRRWCAGLLPLQVDKPGYPALHGALLCPACGAIHGRCADAIFPFLFMAQTTGDRRYVNASLKLYDWMENNVSLPDGAWLNEITVSAWKGTTVFTVIALTESLIHFGGLLEAPVRKRWTERLRRACEWLHREFNIHTGNINYPVACSYALSLAGEYLHEQRFSDKGRALAHESLACFTPNDYLLYGEGHPATMPGPKGCYPVDLGYNVEESLPSLVLYGLHAKDEQVLDTVTRSLRSHLAFMLPDGAWDNSWGTRNYKWTWWGSRTSDGCQPAYALMAGRDPVFYKAALLNTRLLNTCTHNNLLYGGPHYVQHGIKPCIHHTFSHSKALATILVRKPPAVPPPISSLQLPREQASGIQPFYDINTWLLSKGDWRATVTAYDIEYTFKNGHASGGALSLLWHARTGPLLVASMNKYQLQEGFNMQADSDPRSMCLTPRFELASTGAGGPYMNISDLNAAVIIGETAEGCIVDTHSKLVDENQRPAPIDSNDCHVSYHIGEQFAIKASCRAADNAVKFILPIVTTHSEKITMLSPRELVIHKNGAVITVRTNVAMELPLTTGERLFNFVPGMEAFPIRLAGPQPEVQIIVG